MNQQDKPVYQVVLPKLGLTMTEAKILEWLKSDGEWVEKGAPLFVIENEKATVDIESPTSGYLQISIPVGKTVPVLTPVGLISGGESVSAHHAVQPVGQQLDQQAVPGAAPASAKNRAGPGQSEIMRASPKARASARRLGVDLKQVVGSGIRGMVTMKDLPARLADLPAVDRMAAGGVRASPVAQQAAKAVGIDLQQVPGSGPRGMVMRRDVERMVALPTPADDVSLAGLSGLRAIIAERLSHSWRERPQVTLTTEADATYMVAARRQINAEMARDVEPGETPLKISYNALLVRLVALTLEELPYINVCLTAEGITPLPTINVGVAVDSERGLLVPVIPEANRKSLPAIQVVMAGLVERALQGRSMPDDLTGGTFTITNLGAYEVDAFTPIINPPECAILGVGRIIEKPVGMNGQVVLREMMTLSLSFDHRLVDGAPAARFLQRIKQRIENPFALLLDRSEP